MAKDRNHRKIYEYHFGPIPDGWHVHHIDCDDQNNDPYNLIACSPKHHKNIHLAMEMAKPRNCKKCGADYTGKTSVSQFCSSKCAGDYWRWEKGIKKYRDKECSDCGVIMEKVVSSRKRCAACNEKKYPKPKGPAYRDLPCQRCREEMKNVWYATKLCKTCKNKAKYEKEKLRKKKLRTNASANDSIRNI